MPAIPPTCALALPPPLGEDGVAAFLREHFDVVEDPVRRGDRVAYDTADRRLRAAGLTLELERSRAGDRLVLLAPGAPALESAVQRRPHYLIADLPDGPLRARLAGILEVRALLAVARLRSRVRSVRVLDGERKTVVRIGIETIGVVTGDRRSVALTPRVRVTGVLGYDKASARVRRALTQELGLVADGGDPLDEAVRLLGADPRGIVTRVDVELTPTMPADRAAVAVLTALAGVVQDNLPGAIEDLDPEFLHDVRVAVRRTRSVLRELRAVFGETDHARFREELRWVQAVTGPVRDLDVQLEEWESLVAGLAPDQRADLETVRALLVRRRTAALRRLRRDLQGARFQAVWSDWSTFLASDLGPIEQRPDAALPIGEAAGRRIRRVHRSMVRMGRAIDDASPAEDLHELRKRGKELRYLLELFGRLWPPDVVKPMVGALKSLQDVLGRHEDRHVQIDALRALAPRLVGGPRGAQAVLALGVLIERLERDQADARGEFADRFAAFSSRQQRRLVADTFAGGR